MKPGVVIPEIFSTDQQYPLPDESHLLRKGGNREIYVGVFGGRELVVKKTSYRNREYLIHSKLQHQNIIPLQCLMIEERHPSQRRKLLCYHFLPRANGDLAKLAIDSEKNTLKQLKIDLGQDVKLFGSVQENERYFLTQILKGLVYLHNLDIVIKLFSGSGKPWRCLTMSRDSAYFSSSREHPASLSKASRL